MSVLETKVFTKELTSDTLTLTESFGVREISIRNKTAVVGTVTGSESLGGEASGAISLELDETITVVALEASVIKSLVIVAPAGCTLQIVAGV